MNWIRPIGCAEHEYWQVFHPMLADPLGQLTRWRVAGCPSPSILAASWLLRLPARGDIASSGEAHILQQAIAYNQLTPCYHTKKENCILPEFVFSALAYILVRFLFSSTALLVGF